MKITPIFCELTQSRTVQTTQQQCHFMFWLIGVSHAERWKAFPFAVALADLHTHTHTRQRQQEGGKTDNERDRGRACPSVLEPELGQTLLQGGWNTTTFGSRNYDYARCIYVCFMYVRASERVCFLHQKAPLASFAQERKENVIACHKLTNCAKSSPYPIV